MYLQIGIGILPAVVLLCVFAVVKKAHIVKLLYSAGVLAMASATAFVCAGVTASNEIETEENSSVIAVTAEADKQFETAYALALQEDFSGAEDILSDYCMNGMYTNEYTECLARINALAGNYEAAVALYEKADNKDLAEELDACKKALEYAHVDTVLGGVDPTLYGTEEETKKMVMGAVEAIEKAKSVVKKALEKQVSKDFAEAAVVCKEAEDIYEEYLLTGISEEAVTEELLEKFDKMNDSVMKSGYVRLAKLKTLVMAQKYEEIAKDAAQYSDYNELMILAELYVNGYIDEGDFSFDYKTGEDEKYEVLSEWLDTLIEEEYSEDEEERNLEKAEDYAEYFNSYSQKPALSKVKYGLEQYAEITDATDRSKAYMELAKIENYQGNQNASDESMSGALNTVGICRDEAYTTPVYGLIGIIENKEDKESLKNIGTYVDDIITNSTTVKMNNQMYYQNPEKDDVSEDENGEENNQNNNTNQQGTDTNFGNYISDFASRKRSSLSILNINTDSFPQIKATISVDGEISYSAADLKNLLTLRDCGENIANFNIKKVNYTEINFLLCCDTSGSMDGQPIQDLKAAVKMFLEDSKKDVNYSLVTFTDVVETTLPFGTSNDKIAQTLDGIPAVGGTNMYDAVKSAIGQFDDRGALNVIVLLSDGADNWPASYDDIKTNIGRVCADRNVTVYSLGLGEGANAEYLGWFAECTGGEYLYASGSETLLSFYEFIQNISANRYEITFDAKNQALESKRLLEMAINEDELVTTKKYYSLNGEEDNSNTDDTQTEEEKPVNEGAVVSGIDTKFIYATDEEVKIKLLGDKFKKDSFIKVSFSDKISYDIDAEFVNETEYELTLPAGMACGTYNVEITIDGVKFTLENALTVALENGQETVFGKYVFTSLNKKIDGDKIILSGDVKMNGWLSFNGVVTLSGDFSSEKIFVKPSSSAYIHYNKDTSSGLAKIYAHMNNSLQFNLSNGFNIYKNGEDVDEVAIGDVVMLNLLVFSKPQASIYPDKLELDYTSLNTKFMFQDKIVKDNLSKISPFWVEVNEAKAYFTNRTLDVKLDVGGSENEKLFHEVTMGNTRYYINPSDISLTIDTMAGEYEFKFMIKLAFLDAEGFGLSIKWNNALLPNEVMIHADFDVNTNISGVPITFSDFGLGFTDMLYNENDSEYDQNSVTGYSNIKPILRWTLKGQTDISACKVSAILPGIDKYIDDVAVLKLDDTTLELSLAEVYIGFNTELKLLDAITLGKVDLKAGNFDYENEILGINEKVMGIVGKASVGVEWEADNIDLNITASPEISITDEFIGISAEGNFNVELSWWVFEKEIDKNAQAAIGFFVEDNDQLDFTIRAKWKTNKGKTDGICVSWSGKDLDVDTKYFD